MERVELGDRSYDPAKREALWEKRRSVVVCYINKNKSMKANELMIGDWVKVYAESKYYTKQIGIIQLILADYSEPIPLTEEILKANGFIKGDIDFGYSLFSDVSFMIDIDNAEKGIVTKEMRYVHEVQHALRLCGLNELADNFKITHN